MELLLLRHGDAADLVQAGVASDAERPLTEAGQQEVWLVARLMQRLGQPPDRVVTSPLRRARQTAALVIDQLALPAPALVEVALLPEAEPAAMLAAAGRRGRVLLVGHLPSLGRLAGWLIGGDPLLGLPLRTGSLCRIDLAAGAMAGQGDLRWLLPPSLLRRLVERGHGGDRLA